MLRLLQSEAAAIEKISSDHMSPLTLPLSFSKDRRPLTVRTLFSEFIEVVMGAL